ncbi:TlpA family protein disulfide reductase [bacterium]|nr:TlpA family protein disulfide reductase [Flavobacteriaceae bacterium]MDB4148110.1 TlpA family protein disulfide reductase [bacterium]MDB9871448.1 TlpA family protein disulfide reductase [bacterium]MDC0592743.1 TlpA family protein disulfide reductase [Flavobacteriaceae bacterium]MDC1335950.1 TlpA family protein disulfide reductase [Flavobacteriaceae bacterium]
MIELKSLKKLSILLIVLQIISNTALNAQIQSPLNAQEKLDSLKTSLNKVTIMELGGMVKISQEIKGFENDKFLSLDEFQSELQNVIMDPETKLYADDKKMIQLIVFPKKVAIETKIHSDGLIAISSEDFMSRKLRFDNENYAFYDSSNKKLRPEEAEEKFKSGVYKVEAFVNDNDVFKLAYLTKFTQEELQEMMETYQNQSASFDAALKGKPLPDFVFKDILGNTYTPEDIKGKVVVINFWFMSCAPCIEEMPELNKLVKEYENNNDVLFLALTLDEKSPELNKFLKTHVFNYNIIPDSKDYIVKKLQVPAFPTHTVLDKNSNVMFTLAGYTPQVGELIKSSIDYYLE